MQDSRPQLMFHPIKLLWLIPAALIIAISVFLISFSHPYQPDETALQCISVPPPGVEVTDFSGKELVVVPADHSDIKAGFILYSGANVDYRAYSPLMCRLAEKGIACIAPKMPLNFAMLGKNKADDVIERFSDISCWYIGGHSLGGVAASMYLEGSDVKCDGLIHMGSYSSVDLSDKDIPVLLFLAENDSVLNRSEYEKAKVNLPSDWQEIFIDGGCHSYFGSYGAQDGDGIPTCTPEYQWDTVADSIDFMHKK